MPGPLSRPVPFRPSTGSALKGEERSVPWRPNRAGRGRLARQQAFGLRSVRLRLKSGATGVVLW